ncbi:hypothetical protein KM043_010522 [Ampulex compressa]|nr:hypothetical protein KM043_010522 [Ampulex compressa]
MGVEAATVRVQTSRSFGLFQDRFDSNDRRKEPSSNSCSAPSDFVRIDPLVRLKRMPAPSGQPGQPSPSRVPPADPPRPLFAARRKKHRSRNSLSHRDDPFFLSEIKGPRRASPSMDPEDSDVLCMEETRARPPTSSRRRKAA